MRSDIVKMYRDVHSWVGIFSGLCLFIAFYAGAITMFEVPLKRWASPPPSFSEPTSLADSPALIAAATATHPAAAKRFQIYVETGPEKPARMTWEQREPGTGHHGHATHFYANLDHLGQLQVHGQEPSAVAHLVNELHQQVGLPFDHEIAMPIMGVIALLYAVALVSGVIALLPSLVKDLFALRLARNVKRLWLDLHNLLGIFSLPFHIIMALTAVVFAFHDQFYDAQETLLPKTEGVTEVRQAVGEAEAEFDHGREPLPPLQVLEELRTQAPAFEVHYLDYRRGRQGELNLRVAGAREGYGLRGPTFSFANVDPYTGELTGKDYLPGHQDNWFATITSFFALHFGNFGGNGVRWMYFFLGLAGAFLFYSGNLLWIESKRKRRSRSQDPHQPICQSPSSRLLGALTVGVSTGCVAGISLSIAAAKALPNLLADMALVHSLIYYVVFLVCIAWACWRGAARAAVELLWVSAAATMAIPLASVCALLLPAFGWNHDDATWVVDVSAAVGAVALWWAGLLTLRRVRRAPSDSLWYAGEVASPSSQRGALSVSADPG